MIWLALILLIVALFFAIRYFSLRAALQKLSKDMADKRKSQSNLIITGPAYAPLVNEINAIFDEINQIRVASKQEKDTFELALHNITHDIRTPLTIASGYTQTLLHEENNDSLTKIKQNLDTVSKRLEILLEYQHLLESDLTVNLEPLNLTEAVKESLLSFYDALSAQKITVSFDSQPENISVSADREVLSRILQNIFGNVLKHGKEELTVKLESQANKVSLLIKNKSQQPIKNLDKLTSRFYSENLSATESSSGLGLYIAQELAQRIGCDLALAYEEQEFSVVLTFEKILKSKEGER